MGGVCGVGLAQCFEVSHGVLGIPLGIVHTLGLLMVGHDLGLNEFGAAAYFHVYSLGILDIE
jgi:hypothetical protein